MFNSTVYVKISENKFWVRHVENGKNVSVSAVRPFSTPRLLVGDFTAAEHTLKQALKQVMKRGLFAVAPAVLMQPLEKFEGGLSQVEERIFLELAYGSGARKAKVHFGQELTDDGVKAKLKGKA